jgi:hypothetical protein
MEISTMTSSSKQPKLKQLKLANKQLATDEITTEKPILKIIPSILLQLFITIM